MQVFKVNKDLEIVCEAKNTRNGFKHEATLFYKGRERDTAKICYLNRTWERFTYESAIQKVINKSSQFTPVDKERLLKLINKKWGY